MRWLCNVRPAHNTRHIFITALSSFVLLVLACRGVTDIGTGLQAVAAAITDPDTISAFQSEEKNGEMSHRTFYGGLHELSGGVDHAADGIQDLAQVLHVVLSILVAHVPLFNCSASFVAVAVTRHSWCRHYIMWGRGLSV